MHFIPRFDDQKNERSITQVETVWELVVALMFLLTCDLFSTSHSIIAMSGHFNATSGDRTIHSKCFKPNIHFIHLKWSTPFNPFQMEMDKMDSNESNISVCLGVLNDQIFVESLNSTYVVLIPKIKDPRKVADYSPICLCNVVCKIIQKLQLTN